ncbi:MAG: hypothetical protein EB069_02635 [Actinobacteria bacterium]|nr:hypothetical protein [Actinomycetota bacterium]
MASVLSSAAQAAIKYSVAILGRGPTDAELTTFAAAYKGADAIASEDAVAAAVVASSAGQIAMRPGVFSATKQAQIILGNHGITNADVIAYVAGMIDGTNIDAGKVALPLGVVARVVVSFLTKWNPTPANPYNDVFVTGKTTVTAAVAKVEEAIVNPAPVTPSYSLAVDAAKVDEGKTSYFTLTTKNVANGTVLGYVIKGVEASDIVGGALSGTTTVGGDGLAVIAVSFTKDDDAADKTVSVTVAGQTASVLLVDAQKAAADKVAADKAAADKAAADKAAADATKASDAAATAVVADLAAATKAIDAAKAAEPAFADAVKAKTAADATAAKTDATALAAASKIAADASAAATKANTDAQAAKTAADTAYKAVLTTGTSQQIVDAQAALLKATALADAAAADATTKATAATAAKTAADAAASDDAAAATAQKAYDTALSASVSLAAAADAAAAKAVASATSYVTAAAATKDSAADDTAAAKSKADADASVVAAKAAGDAARTAKAAVDAAAAELAATKAVADAKTAFDTAKAKADQSSAAATKATSDAAAAAEKDMTTANYTAAVSAKTTASAAATTASSDAAAVAAAADAYVAAAAKTKDTTDDTAASAAKTAAGLLVTGATSNRSAVAAISPTAPEAGKSLSLTTVTGEKVSGGTGPDTITALDDLTSSTLNAYDSVDGGADIDSIIITSTKNQFEMPVGVSIQKVENLTLSTVGGVATRALPLALASYGDVVKATISSAGGTFVKANASQSVTVANGALEGGVDTLVDGGNSVTVTTRGASAENSPVYVGIADDGTGTLVASGAAKGAVSVTSAVNSNVYVNGGTDVNVTLAQGMVAIGRGSTTGAMNYLGSETGSKAVSPTGAISVTSAKQAGDTIAINGGTTVNVTASGATASSATINVGGGSSNPKGSVTITQTASLPDSGANTNVAPTITSKGGSAVSISQKASGSATLGASNDTITHGVVTVTGTEDTTSVTVDQAARASLTQGRTEVNSVLFYNYAGGGSPTSNYLVKGQSVTVGGLTLTANGPLTGEEVAAAYAGWTLGATTFAGLSGNGTWSGALSSSWSAARTDSGISGTDPGATYFTSSTRFTNVANIIATATSAALPTLPAIATTQGSSTKTESAEVKFTSLAGGQSVTVGGYKFTATANGASATDVANAFANLKNGSATGSSSLSGWSTGAASGDTVTFTASTPKANVTDLAASVANATSPAAPFVAASDLVDAVGSSTNAGLYGTPTTGLGGLAGNHGIANGAVVITDVNALSVSDAGKISNVKLNNFGTASVESSALSTIDLSGRGTSFSSGIGQLSTPTLSAQTLKLTGVSVSGEVTLASSAKSILVETSVATNQIAGKTNAAGATSVVITGNAALTLASSVTSATATGGLVADLATSLTINNSAATVLGLDTKLASSASISNMGTGSVTIRKALESTQSYTGGSGNDTISVTGPTTKAISLGDGSDFLTYSGSSVGTGGSIDGGPGTDTLRMSAFNASTSNASADTAFSKMVTNFERLSLTGASGQTVDLKALGNYGYVSIDTDPSTGTTVLDNFVSGGTLALNVAGTGYEIRNAVAFTASSADSVTINLTAPEAGRNFGSVALLGVESANIVTTNSSVGSSVNSVLASLTLTGTALTTVTASGNYGLTLTLTGTTPSKLDASGISQGSVSLVGGAYTWADSAQTISPVVIGSATRKNTVDLSESTAAVVYNGGSGQDIVNLGTSTKAHTINLGNGGTSSAQQAVNGTGDANVKVFGGTGIDSIRLSGSGDMSVTGGGGNDTIVLGSGRNLVELGAGSSTVTVGSGANVINALQSGQQTINLNGAATTGKNTVNLLSDLGDADLVRVGSSTAASVFTTITGLTVGDKLGLNGTAAVWDWSGVNGTPLSATGLFSLPTGLTGVFGLDSGVSSFTDFINAAFEGTGTSTSPRVSYFTFGGNTFVTANYDGPGFTPNLDVVVRLTGIYDLTTATLDSSSFTTLTIGSAPVGG